MFEKDLYDLIRGLRNHKGNERAYIQDSIRECRKEVKGSDMDLKATALLKLTYLEMFGHDMSWASFNVLEVMSSQSYMQKRVGYLAAVQSFRPDTEVLMLAENLLKKDLMSPQHNNMSLPLVAIPHVVSPSMANSLLTEILPRLSHSNPNIRKKTVVTLYRLALVYPDTLRPAWPKIKERLNDDNEDPSVTAAVINVICELGWRRPQDFLPMAPRLFDLLVEGNNNWMAIKIIKLFAALTPLEPRLVKKLLPPLTTLIKTTPAMSLLYECIDGIIQGGIFETASGTTEGDEIARLCVSKLRGMLGVAGDPNLKYVALLAFNKIVVSHPYLVSQHEDVIMECIDDADISIRLRALDLVVGMVNASNLTSIVDRLMGQLSTSSTEAAAINDPANDRSGQYGIEPTADYDDDDQTIDPHASSRSEAAPPIPDEYRSSAIQRILEICSASTYANIDDFDWYIETLTLMVRCVPTSIITTAQMTEAQARTSEIHGDLAQEIGAELRNVAARVKSSRREATQAAEALVTADPRSSFFPQSGNSGQGVLGPAAWVVGEYASLLRSPNAVMDALLYADTVAVPADVLSIYVQTAMKVFAHMTGDELQSWKSERKTMVTLLLARLVHWLEPLTSHPSLEVQERSVEFLELTKLTSEAVEAHDVATDGTFTQPPLLLTQAIPSLFSGMELNPVAREAQRKVPIPNGLDLDVPINDQLQQLLNVGELGSAGIDDIEFHRYYHERVQKSSFSSDHAVPAASLLAKAEAEAESYQQGASLALDPADAARRRLERRERHKDDPFYIPSDDGSGTATPIHSIIKGQNGEELDVDSIPVMELNLEGLPAGETRSRHTAAASAAARKKPRRRDFEIVAEDDIGSSGTASQSPSRSGTPVARSAPGRRALLQVDSSGLGSLSLSETNRNSRRTQLDYERRAAEEAEMAAAVKEVERLRLEMQRAQERIEARQSEPTVPLRKKKKKIRSAVVEGSLDADEADSAEKPKKKKKKKPKTAESNNEDDNEQRVTTEASEQLDSVEPEVGGAELDASETVKPKKKKKTKRREAVIEDDAAPTSTMA